MMSQSDGGPDIEPADATKLRISSLAVSQFPLSTITNGQLSENKQDPLQKPWQETWPELVF